MIKMELTFNELLELSHETRDRDVTHYQYSHLLFDRTSFVARDSSGHTWYPDPDDMDNDDNLRTEALIYVMNHPNIWFDLCINGDIITLCCVAMV